MDRIASAADVQRILQTRCYQTVDAGRIVRRYRRRAIQREQVRAEKIKISPSCDWHLIGHLQSNKAKYTVKIFDLIIPLCAQTGKEIDKQAAGQQSAGHDPVSIAGETAKAGCVIRPRRISAENSDLKRI
jgi:uncharacterized pyridoxal phosphate-containing UPF0001 family protein